MVGIVGTSPETVEPTRATLGSRYGIDCRGYTSLDAALDAEQPGIVAICSPYRLHREHLRCVAEFGAHCLCEKPMWWGEATERALETRRLVDLFTNNGVYLDLLTQWPQTLPTFYQLFPHEADRPLRRFEMHMGPTSSGADMVLDAAPHGISMLQALAGEGGFEDVQASFSNEQRHLELSFTYRPHAPGADAVEGSFRYEQHARPPRPASYSINGCKVRRQLEMPDYRMRFSAGDRSVPLDDPLKLLVRNFLRQIDDRVPLAETRLVESIRGLESLWAATTQIEN